MSYAIRNSLILLSVLLLLTAGGWAYLEFIQQPQIESLQTELSSKQNELESKQAIANQYDTVLRQYEEAQDFIANYDKTLYRDSNEDKVFDFINNLNTGSSFTDFTFAFQDSTSEGQYGILTMDVSGSGYYRNVVNFIRRIELSKPINKLSQVSITPINNLENYGRVNFSFTLESFYDRQNATEPPDFTITSSIYNSVYNPFYPLIRDVQPNDNNLINVENSNLIAISTHRVFLIDQNGVMQQLEVGSPVYLGQLISINLSQKTATFRLNKGGISEQVTLEVNNEPL